MKVKFCVLSICLWNFSLILASSPEVVKRSAEDPDSVFQGNFYSTTGYYHHHYHPHHHPRPHSVPHPILQPHYYPPRLDNYNILPRYEGYPWRRPGAGPPRNDHHSEHSSGEPTWDQNAWNDPSDTWPPSTGSSPGTDGYTDFDKKTEDNQDKEHLPDCHCKFENVGSRTIVTVSVKTMPTMTTPLTTTSTSTTPSTSTISTTTEFDWNTYVEKELTDELGKNNSAGIGLIDVRLKESD